MKKADTGRFSKTSSIEKSVPTISTQRILLKENFSKGWLIQVERGLKSKNMFSANSFTLNPRFLEQGPHERPRSWLIASLNAEITRRSCSTDIFRCPVSNPGLYQGGESKPTAVRSRSDSGFSDESICLCLSLEEEGGRASKLSSVRSI